MNKSVEFVKNRIINGLTNEMPTDGWTNAEIVNPIKQYMRIPEFTNVLKDNKITVIIKCDQGESKIIVKYNPDSEFDYFTTKSTTHDGTTLFTFEAINEILFRPFQFATMPKSSGINQSNFTEYDYEYIIGDIIIHREFGRKNINGHNWYGETDTIVMPIKFKCVPH